MGYSTTFKGVLYFNDSFDSEMHNLMESFLGEDCRDHPEWGHSECLTYMDLTWENSLRQGLIWDGSEKTYNMVEKVNLITHNMRKQFPDFSFKPGSFLTAQGEDIEDRWYLYINDEGIAEERQDLENTPKLKEKILEIVKELKEASNKVQSDIFLYNLLLTLASKLEDTIEEHK